MEQFGWSLQGRQEIHEEGDAYGRPSYLSDNTYVIKTKVSHYVKLHFVRSLALTNLPSIKSLEQQYFSIPFPEFPRLLPGGFALIIFWYPFWPLWFFFGYKPKKKAAEAKLNEVREAQREIVRKATALLAPQKEFA